jgi:hypothetical protein
MGEIRKRMYIYYVDYFLFIYWISKKAEKCKRVMGVKGSGKY